MTSARRFAAIILAVAALLALFAVLANRQTQLGTKDVESAPFPAAPSPSVTSAHELPEPEQRSALAGLCANSGKESGNDRSTPEETQARIEAFNKAKRSLSERLSISSSAEHLHLAALLDDHAVSRIELLERAVSVNPNDGFLLWSAVQICVEERDATGCPLRDWEQRLLEIDGQNSESWVRVAANRYAAGESDAALEAMRHAGSAAESRAYWTETIEMVERGFAAAGGDHAFPEQAAMAFGFAASQLPNYGDYVTMCKEQSARSVDWAYACLAYGELVENQGKTDLGVAVARSIQKLAFEALDDLESTTAVEQRRQAHRQEMRDSVGDSQATIERLIVSSPALFSAYLAAVRTHGESGARAYLANETSRILQEHPELACEP